MSIPEQAGKVATSAIEAMKTNPSCLAALLIVALVAVLSYFESERRDARMQRRAEEVGELLKACLAAKTGTTP